MTTDTYMRELIQVSSDPTRPASVDELDNSSKELWWAHMRQSSRLHSDNLDYLNPIRFQHVHGQVYPIVDIRVDDEELIHFRRLKAALDRVSEMHAIVGEEAFFEKISVEERSFDRVGSIALVDGGPVVLELWLAASGLAALAYPENAAEVAAAGMFWSQGNDEPWSTVPRQVASIATELGGRVFGEGGSQGVVGPSVFSSSRHEAGWAHQFDHAKRVQEIAQRVGLGSVNATVISQEGSVRLRVSEAAMPLNRDRWLDFVSECRDQGFQVEGDI